MNSYSIFAIVLTVAYLIYYAVIVAHDLYGKKKMCKTSEEVFDLGEPGGRRKHSRIGQRNRLQHR